MRDGHLRWIKAVQNRINFGKTDSQTIHSSAYDGRPKAWEFEKREIDWMLATDFIEPMQMKWASPIALVPKEDKNFRFCVHYCKLNSVKICDYYSIPRMAKFIDSLGDKTIFAILDGSSGYWQSEFAEKDLDKTAFTFHHGLFLFALMQLGLKPLRAVLASDGCLTHESQGAICPFLLRRHRDIF